MTQTNRNTIVVDVLFPVALQRTLSYLHIQDPENSVSVGSFVRASLGTRTFLGIVIALRAREAAATPEKAADTTRLKYITSVENHLMPVPAKRIELWKWISDYYLCTLGEVMKAAIPRKPPVQTAPPSLPESPLPSEAHLPSLSPAQTEAIRQIREEADRSGIVVLKGIRGRLEVYIHLLYPILLLGQSALLLIPEAGAGEQLYLHIRTIFGARAQLLHSRLSPGKRQKLLQAIASRETPLLVVGQRSSLLHIDIRNFGLIVVDEEQDISYKQMDPAPRFHARDLALFMGRHYQIPVILGSSCASLESEYNIRSGKYSVVTLDDSNRLMPRMEIIDTFRQGKKKLMHGSISRMLLDALEQNVSRGKQALLFSRHCAPLQEDLAGLLPALKTARLDEQHTPRALQQLLTKFLNQEIDVLIGSQNVHKNLDFENIGLIGILEADKQLSRLDFRAHERAYQIFTTLSGHIDPSSRADLPSPPRVIIQTARADQPFYRYLQEHDFNAFVLEQLQERKTYQYPPFVRLIALRFKHVQAETAFRTAEQFAGELAGIGIVSVSGPFTPYHHPNHKLHTQLLWVHLDRRPGYEAMKKALYKKVLDHKFRGGIIQIDVDPY